jgi:transcriptional regulator with XRE-family HTH domain
MASTDPGQFIRERRQRHGLSQAQLALRAGTTQSAISRLERGERSPTVETLQLLLSVLGEELILTRQRMVSYHDLSQVAAFRQLTMAERMEEAVQFNTFAAALLGAAKKQCEAG